MTVDIEVDLDISGVQDEIAALKTELKSIDEDLDIGDFDFDDLVASIEDSLDDMDDLEVDVVDKKLKKELSGLQGELSELNTKLDKLPKGISGRGGTDDDRGGKELLRDELRDQLDIEPETDIKIDDDADLRNLDTLDLHKVVSIDDDVDFGKVDIDDSDLDFGRRRDVKVDPEFDFEPEIDVKIDDELDLEPEIDVNIDDEFDVDFDSLTKALSNGFDDLKDEISGLRDDVKNIEIPETSKSDDDEDKDRLTPDDLDIDISPRGAIAGDDDDEVPPWMKFRNKDLFDIHVSKPPEDRDYDDPFDIDIAPRSSSDFDDRPSTGFSFRRSLLSRKTGSMPELEIPEDSLKPDMELTELDFAHKKDFKEIIDANDELNDGFGKLKKKIGFLKPTFGKFFQLLALLAPILGAAAAQALGVAAAFGAIAVAAGSIVGLGLLGGGSNLKDSVEDAKEDVKELKTELFQAVQPAAQAFEPIQDRIFQRIPTLLRGVTEEMRGLTSFEGTIFNVMRIGATFIERLIGTINSLDGAISQMVNRFSAILANTLLNIIRNMIIFAHRNQDMLVSLGDAILKVVRGILQLSVAVTKIVLIFKPLIEIFAWITDLLSNKFVQSFLVAGTAILFTVVALSKLAVALAFLKAGALPAVIASMKVMIAAMWTAISNLPLLISEIWAMNAALGVTAALVATATAGLAALGAGAVLQGIWNDNGGINTAGSQPRPISQRGGMGGRRGPSGKTEINVQGDMDRYSEQKIMDVAGNEDRTRNVRN